MSEIEYWGYSWLMSLSTGNTLRLLLFFGQIWVLALTFNTLIDHTACISKNSGVFSIQTTYLLNLNRALKSLTPWKNVFNFKDKVDKFSGKYGSEQYRGHTFPNARVQKFEEPKNNCVSLNKSTGWPEELSRVGVGKQYLLRPKTTPLVTLRFRISAQKWLEVSPRGLDTANN